MAASVPNSSGHIRLRVRATGALQGVGFRPYVFQVARASCVTGSIANVGGGVQIEVEGRVSEVRKFVASLRDSLPPHAEIRSLQVEELTPVGSESGFEIATSIAESGVISILPDLRVCDECLAELFARKNRRAQYGLIACTHCGPRFSIIERVPFDRANTTLAAFPLCENCSGEYTNPKDRRFHAQAIACDACGPRVSIVDAGRNAGSGDPISEARQLLLGGGIVAIKGIGGFHLAARADDAKAIERLRHRKHRDAKPFAVMAANLESARKLVKLSSQGEDLLISSIAPVVIAASTGSREVCGDVAPGMHRLGVMLPYTPIHHQIFADGMPPLVMTSANDNGEPIVFKDEIAFHELKGCFDAMLWHDRPIARGIDDSVVIDVDCLSPILVRRARGYVPTEIGLCHRVAVPGLAVGGELKSAFAIVQQNDAILSQHLGDLGNTGAFERFTETIEDFTTLFDLSPQWIVRDAHPQYFSSQHAQTLADRFRVPLITVQHHHAHAASVLAEHQVTSKALALVCDGTGYGADHTIWGGELLLADLKSYKRLARLRPLRLPGGDAAARDTTRCAMALLFDAYGSGFDASPRAGDLIPDPADRELVELMIRSNVSCAQSSGAGRYFDGVSALLGLCSRNTYEGQAAMMLEAAADRAGGNLTVWEDGFTLSETDGLIELSFAPFIRSLCGQMHRNSPEEWAAEFHEQFVRGWMAVLLHVSQQIDLHTIALSGGVFCNARLVRRLTELLESHRFTVLRNRLVPPNDGGLALGQAAIAAAVMQDCGLSLREVVCV